MQAKIRALEENQTWQVVDLSPNVVPIRSKWVFKIKRKCDGSLSDTKLTSRQKGTTRLKDWITSTLSPRLPK